LKPLSESFTKRWSAIILYICTAVAVTIVFYTSPLRKHFGNYTYDQLMKFNPNQNTPQTVILIDVDKNLKQPPSADLHFTTLEKYRIVANTLKETTPTVVAYLFLPSIFEFTRLAAHDLTGLNHPNALTRFGVMGFDFATPSQKKLPPPIARFTDALFGMETFRQRRQQTVRAVPNWAFRGNDRRRLIASQIHLDFIKLSSNSKPVNHTAQIAWEPSSINYFNNGNYHRHSLEDLIRDPVFSHKLDGAIILVGSSLYRERPIRHDQIYLNTPWQVEGEDPSKGVSVIELIATHIDNLISHTEIYPLSYEKIWSTLEFMIISLLTLLLWRRSLTIALIGTLTIIATTFLAHGLLLSHAQIYFPLSDSFWFLGIFTAGAALWRVRNESRKRGIAHAKNLAFSDLNRMQGRFLDQFATLIQSLNHKIQQTIKRHSTEMAPEIQPNITRLLLASEELDDFVHNIDQFSRITESRIRVNRQKFNLQEAINRIILQFDLQAFTKNIELQLITKSDRLDINTDSTLFEAVIHNLLSNAIKFAPDGSKIFISVIESDHYIEIGVRDQGKGIDPKFHERIFERFYRVSDKTDLGTKGTGIGLYLSRYFCELMKCKIRVESTLGKGASFYVAFKKHR
jgi:signal transduction histidine kinase